MSFSENSPAQFCGIPLESDPTIFTDLMHALCGVRSHPLTCVDLLSLDPDDLVPGGPLALPGKLRGIILVYNTSPAYESSVDSERQKARDAGRGYAGRGSDEPMLWVEQIVPHACGFFALMHIVSNLSRLGVDSPYIDPDSPMGKFIASALPMSPPDRASFLESFSPIAALYNDCAPLGTSQVLHADDVVPGHYAAFIPSQLDGHIYEMDGGKNGPVDHDEWLDGERDILIGGTRVVKEIVKIHLDPENAHFHALAVVEMESRREQ